MDSDPVPTATSPHPADIAEVLSQEAPDRGETVPEGPQGDLPDSGSRGSKAPEGFKFPIEADMWAPLEVNPLEHDREDGPQYPGFGRLKPGVLVDRASADLATIGMRLEQEYPESNEGFAPIVEPFTKFVIGDELHALLFTMLGAAIGVLLIGCANVANLLFARAAVREKEVAAAASNARNVGDVFKGCGRRPQCGKCLRGALWRGA